MKNNLESVNEFHVAFKVGEAPEKPTLIDKKDYLLRYNLKVEENKEYLDACKNEDLVEVADALGDELYVLCGTILKHGMQDVIEKVFNEIHSSNMSKLGTNGRPILREDGKVLKGKNYFKPNIKQILDEKF